MVSLVSNFTMVIAGMSGSGKTSLIMKLVEEQRELFEKPFSAVYYFYTAYQPMFEDMESRLGIRFVEGAPTEESFDKLERGSLCILDDMLSVMCTSKTLVDIYCIKSHHQGVSVIFTSKRRRAKGIL